MVEFMEYYTRYNRLVIVRPTSYYGIKGINQFFLCPGFSLLDYITDFLSKFINGFLGRFNKKFALIFSEIPSEEIKTIVYMGYYRFLIRQFQTSTFQEIFNQFLDFLGYFLRFCSNNKIVGIPYKIHFEFGSLNIVYIST